jgi:Mannosyltransferase (PIG-V)
MRNAAISTSPSLRKLRRKLLRKLRRIIALLPKQDWIVVGWVLAIKLLLLLFGIKAYEILENKRPTGPRPWLEIWNRWDSLHYQSLAQFGYDRTNVWKAWFYPLFPWCVRVAGLISRNYLIGAFIVSGLAVIAAAIVLRRLVQLDFQSAVALRAVWFLLIFPTTYFLHIGYTESLFLALVLGSIFAARDRRWWLAGLLGAFSWMTRANGIVLLPTLGAEALHQFVATRRWQWRWLWIGIVPAGFAVYLLLNWHVTGDPFMFLRMRKPLFVITPAWPWVGIRNAIGNLQRAPNEAEMVGAQELFFTIMGLICAIVSWFKLRPTYAVWITGNWLLCNCATFIESAPRYALSMFPIFVLFALLAANRFWNMVITVWSLLFLALFASLFVRGWWAF